MGDLNLDLLRYNHHVPTQEFIDSLFSYAFLLLISNPTRLTTYSARLIDNIFTNNLAHNVLCGMILNDLSDHLPVFAYFDDATVNAQHRKENYDDISMTIICINSTRTFQTQNGPYFATWKIPMKPIMILLKNTPESITPVSL